MLKSTGFISFAYTSTAVVWGDDQSMTKLNALFQKLFPRQTKNNAEPLPKVNYKILSPIKRADIKNYEEALDFVFLNNEIKNVAISGAYCSGKSSIIETYEDKRKEELKMLHISLAHFCAVNQSSEDINKAKDKNRATIESKILNQLIQQIPGKSIKLTKFRIKKNTGKSKAFGLSAILCIFISLLIYCIKFYSWGRFVNRFDEGVIKEVLLKTTEPGARILCAVVILLILGLMICKLVYAQYTNSFIRKISFQGNEIDIGNKSKDSFFDRYLNEVLYIFEQADVDAIVFEDIDRFNDLALFERLREINTLVNIRKSQKKKGKKTMRFLYMMRDDLFLDFKDRTKFFDFIIPVIPIVDGSNSYSKIKDYMTAAGLISSFDDHFLKEISLYIDDYRILKNINNELLLYNENLKDSKLDLNRLLALLTYKNIFPKDYDELRFRRGCVFSFFNAESKIKDTIKKPIYEKEKQLREELELIKNEYQDSIRKIRNKSNNVTEASKTQLTISSGKIPITSSMDEKEYQKVYDKNVKELNDSIKEQIKKQTEIDNLPLNELLSRYSSSVFNYDYLVDSIKVPVELVENKYFGLIKFLLSSGYIDASYSDYMTYYYENDLSINDTFFIRAVLERNRQDYGYKLEAPKLVIESLKPNYFSQSTTLNYDLYDCIFSKGYSSQARSAMSLFESSQRAEYLDFIEGYLFNGRNVGGFVKDLVETWIDVFDYAQDAFSDEALRKLCILIVKYCSKETIELLRSQEKLSKYLSSTPSIFTSGIYSEKLRESLIALNIKFTDLEDENIDSENLAFLYKNHLYEINETNIHCLLKTKCGVKDVDSVLKAFFSFVYSHRDKYIFCRHVINNINTVVPIYLNMFNGEIEDDPATACKVINNCYYEIVEQYINRLKTSIENIKQIDNLEYLPLLIKRKCVSYNIDNIMNWYNRIGKITHELVAFIDSDESIIHYNLNNQRTSVFLSDLLGSEELSDDKYLQIVQSLDKRAINHIISANVSEHRMTMLIDSQALKCTKNFSNYIRNNYPKLLELYISKNIEDYFSEELSIADKGDLDLALSSSLIVEPKKKELLKKCSIPVSLVGKNYSDELTKYIFINNFDINDLAFYAESFNSRPDYVKKKIVSVIVSNPFEIIKLKNKIDHELKLIILSVKEIELYHRIRFLSMYIDDIDQEDLYVLLQALGAEKIAMNISGANSKVTVDRFNRNVLRILWKKHIIEYPTKTASGKYYQKIHYISKEQRPHINSKNTVELKRT